MNERLGVDCNTLSVSIENQLLDQLEEFPTNTKISASNGLAENANITLPLSVDVKTVPIKEANESIAIDRSVRENEIESDRAYRKITEDIIQATTNQLMEHTKAKNPLRTTLMRVVSILLGCQFLALIVLLFTNTKFELNISDEIFKVYIISVFVETLAGLMIMIRFSFDTTQEIELIKILNSIIINFKKYSDKSPKDE